MLLAGLGHLALWVEVVNRTHGVGWSKGVVDSWTIACGVGFFAVPLYALWAGVTGLSAAPAPLYGYAMVCYAALLGALFSRWGLLDRARRDRRVVHQRTERLDLLEKLGNRASGSPALARVARAPGNELLKPLLEERVHSVERLPKELVGLRVAHLTDLHMSPRLTLEYFHELILAVNAWEPDLVCVTGDIVERPAQLEWVEPTLGALRARLGAYFVLGNHDRYAGAEAVRERLVRAGLVDLGGRALRLADAPLTLCGDERPWFESEPSLGTDEPFVLCLAHTPDRLAWAAEQGVDLVLAGHCHGGQVCFPGLGALLCPSRYGARYAAGSFRLGRTAMHVSRGAGSLFPVRWLCPPEVGLMTLSRLSPAREGSTG